MKGTKESVGLSLLYKFIQELFSTIDYLRTMIFNRHILQTHCTLKIKHFFAFLITNIM